VSQGQKVIAEIKLIRAALAEEALAKPGQIAYQMQKLPRQAVWVIHQSNDKSYRLTYQPAPLNAWSLYPPDSESFQLLDLIDQALRHQSLARSDEVTTAYRQQLHPWCIIQLLPDMQHREVGRFRRRNDADAHMRVLRQQASTIQYTIIFDTAVDP
jgi:hypothetical protein